MPTHCLPSRPRAATSSHRQSTSDMPAPAAARRAAVIMHATTTARRFAAIRHATTMARRPATMLLAVSLSVALTACSDATDTTPDIAIPPVPVALGDVVRESVKRPVVATGVFGPKDEVSLSFKIGGIVSRVSVDEGASVQRGTVIASLDLREIDAQLTKARIGLERATRDVVRLRALQADSVATLANLQDAESALAAAQADMDAAKVNREYAVITAPVSGRVLRRRVQPGALVSSGQEVLSLGSDARGRVVRVGVPDRDAVRLSLDMRAEVFFEAMPGRTFTGRVSQRGAITDPRTGMVSVEVRVDGADALPAGTVARVSIAVPSATDVTLVPAAAVIEADGDSATVYSIRDGRAVRHSVRVLFISGDRIAVQGLDSVSRVVSDGAAYLSDGAAVRNVGGAK